MHDQPNGDFRGCKEHVKKLPANCLFVVFFITASTSRFDISWAESLFLRMHGLQRASVHLPVCFRLGNSSNQCENSDLFNLFLHWRHCHNCQQPSHRARSALFLADFVFMNCVNEVDDDASCPQSWHVLGKCHILARNEYVLDNKTTIHTIVFLCFLT